MSYDNSELLKAYLDAHAAFGTEEYAEVARGIVRWVREVASDPEAGYAASQDADVGLEDDGDYFTWTRDEAAAVLSGDELDVAAAYYDIGTAGEMHHNPGKNVLYVAASLPALARVTGLAEDAARLLLGSARRKLLEARASRPTPFVDRTRYTNWNAMMASAMLRAGAVLDDAAARRHALATLALLREQGAEPDALPHTPGGIGGLLDDQVQTAAAALDAYESTGDTAWLAWAERLMQRVWTDYWDDGAGGLFDTARGPGRSEGLLPARVKPVQDTPTPSPNGVAGITLVRLHELTGEARWRERAAALMSAFAGGAVELGPARRGASAGARLVPQSHHAPRRGGRRGRRDRRADASCGARGVRASPGGAAAHAGRSRRPGAAAGAGRRCWRREPGPGATPASAPAAASRRRHWRSGSSWSLLH